MPGYLLDTNVLISWFGGRKEADRMKELLESPENDFFTSIVCIAEFLAGCSPDDSARIKTVIENGEIRVLPFSAVLQAESAARLRKSLGLKMPDAIVAAAAEERELFLFTLDEDFRKKVCDCVKCV